MLQMVHKQMAYKMSSMYLKTSRLYIQQRLTHVWGTRTTHWSLTIIQLMATEHEVWLLVWRQLTMRQTNGQSDYWVTDYWTNGLLD